MWTTRWGAINHTMTATAARYIQLGQPPGHPQIAVLGQAVALLQSFTDELFDLFYTGFANGRLALSSQYPADYVYAGIQEQAQYDLQVLQMAADQRLNAPYSPMLDTLNVADVLAQRALTQAQSFLPEGMRVVTYFQKSSSIRVLPYANLALIGIPYSSIDYHPSLLTIPHELGHFVFWHGQLSGEPTYQQSLQHQLSLNVRTALSSLSINQLSQTVVATPASQLFYRWCYVWLEEMFADLFGCWVAGPVSALTMQEIVLHRPYYQMTTSDADHPVGIVRPYAQLKTLFAPASAQPNWSACATLLLNHWQTNVPAGLDRFSTPDAGEIMLTNAVLTGLPIDINYPVDRMVVVVGGILSRCTSDDWRIQTTAPVTAPDLKDQFEDFYQSQLSVALPPLTPPLTGLGSVLVWADRYFNLSTNLRAVLNKTAPTAPVAPAEWWPIAQGRSWTTEPANWPRPD